MTLDDYSVELMRFKTDNSMHRKGMCRSRTQLTRVLVFLGKKKIEIKN